MVHYVSDGLLLSETDACNNTINYGYDAAGNVTAIVYPEENQDTFSYEYVVLAEATRADITTMYDYDALGFVSLDSFNPFGIGNSNIDVSGF